MKFIRLAIPSISILAVNPGIINPPVLETVNMSTSIIGVIKDNNDFNYNLTINNFNNNDQLDVKYAYAHNGSVFCHETYTLIKASSSIKSKTMNLTFPVRGYLTSNGIKLTATVSGASTLAVTYEATLLPKSEEVINGDLYRDWNGYTANNFIFKFETTKKNSFNSEKYIFADMQSNLTNDYENKLYINSRFAYGKSQAATNDAYGYLTFTDTYNLFPYMEKSNKVITLPLHIDKKSALNYITYNNEMYVNPYTLQMASHYRFGFVTTNNFYLPIEESKKMEDYTFYIHLRELGYSEIDVDFSLTYSNEYKIFGSCDSATYCIGGGIVE